MKSFRVLLFFLVVVRCAIGQAVTPDVATATAVNELYLTERIEVSPIEVRQKVDSKGRVLLYQVNTSANRSVLLSGHESCVPVLGRFDNPTGASIFEDNADLPCGLKAMIEYYAEQVAICYDSSYLIAENQNTWKNLSKGTDIYSAKKIGSVSPLITTSWGQSITNDNQDDGFNYYCPHGNDCSHCLVGCIAVAMGQIANYWKYPVISFEKKQFDWCNMQDSLLTTSPNFVKERDAISWLLFQCGKYAEMDYGCENSSSYVNRAKSAFDSLKYDSKSEYAIRFLNGSKWRKKYERT